jgi:hypothetical protein
MKNQGEYQPELGLQGSPVDTQSGHNRDQTRQPSSSTFHKTFIK